MGAAARPCYGHDPPFHLQGFRLTRRADCGADKFQTCQRVGCGSRISRSQDRPPMLSPRGTVRACLPLAALTVAGTLVGAQVSAQSASREQMRAELTAELGKYVAAFSQGRVDFIADSVYTAPAYFFGAGPVDVRMTRDDVLSRFEDMWAPLPAQGYDRSEIRGSDVCILNNSAALVTLEFARLRRDGSVIMEGTAIYFYARTEQGWRVSSSIGPGPRIECGDQGGRPLQ